MWSFNYIVVSLYFIAIMAAIICIALIIYLQFNKLFHCYKKEIYEEYKRYSYRLHKRLLNTRKKNLFLFANINRDFDPTTNTVLETIYDLWHKPVTFSLMVNRVPNHIVSDTFISKIQTRLPYFVHNNKTLQPTLKTYKRLNAYLKSNKFITSNKIISLRELQINNEWEAAYLLPHYKKYKLIIRFNIILDFISWLFKEKIVILHKRNITN